MQLRAGIRLRSQVDGTEVLVIRAPAREVTVSCDDRPMVELPPRQTTDFVTEGAEQGDFGHRFRSADGELDLLVIKAGQASLSADGVLLQLCETGVNA